MTIEEAARLQNGVYFVEWLGWDGGSVAAIGHNEKGNPWLAPANWTFITSKESALSLKDTWANVTAVELITTERTELKKRGLS